MKLCIVIFGLSVAGFGTAVPLSWDDADLELFGRDGVLASSLQSHENENERRRLPLSFSDRGLGALVESRLQRSSSELSSRQRMGTSNISDPKAQPSVDLEPRDHQEEQAVYTKANSGRYPRDHDLVTRHRIYIHSANTGGNEILSGADSKLEARGRDIDQDKSVNGHSKRYSQSSDASTSPFGSPRAQAGSSIRPSTLESFGRWSMSSLDGSGELVDGHLSNEPSHLHREGSFEHITPSIEEASAKPKTSRSTKLYRGAGVGVHYIRSNPKEAGLVALSAFGQATAVGALGPLVYGNKGVGMAIAGVGALANFAAYSGQAATNVKKWQRTEAKIPKEKQGEPLDPLIGATKALADKSSQMTGVAKQRVVKPFQIAGGTLKKVVPGGMKKVQSEPNMWQENHERRSVELGEEDVDALLPRTLPQKRLSALQTRSMNTVVSGEDSSLRLHPRGTPPGKTGEGKNSPPKNPLPGPTGTSSSTSRSRSSSPDQLPQRSSSMPGSVSMSATQTRDKSPQRTRQQTTSHQQSASSSESRPLRVSKNPLALSPPRQGGRRSFDVPARLSSASRTRSRSASPSRYPRINLMPLVNDLSASTLDKEKGRTDSPRPKEGPGGQIIIPHPPRQLVPETGSSKRPTSPERTSSRELQPLTTTIQTSSSSTTSSLRQSAPPTKSPSSPKRTGSEELRELNRLLSEDWSSGRSLSSSSGKLGGRPHSPERSASPPKRVDSGEFSSPRSAFEDGGFSMPDWHTARTPTASPPDSPPNSPRRLSPQTKSQALAELKREEAPSEPDEPSESIPRSTRIQKLPKMRQGAPPTITLSRHESGSSSARSSPFGSPEYQTRPPFKKPPRDYSKDWPPGFLPSLTPALPQPPPSPE